MHIYCFIVLFVYRELCVQLWEDPVNWWSLVPIPCQLKSPVWGDTTQLWALPSCEAALGPSPSVARPHWPAQFCASWLCSGVSGQLGKLSLWGRESALQWQRGADFYWEKSPPLILDWSILIQMKTPNPHCLIGLTSPVLSGQNGATLVSKDVDGDVAVLGGKPQSYLLK